VPVELAEPGHKITLDSPDGSIPAITAALPFIDPNKNIPRV
jgi:hypothetical protein